jgi:hypothetical protein
MAEPLVLSTADYWKLKALRSDLIAARLKAEQMVQAASRAHDAHLQFLSANYVGLEMNGTAYRLDDATHALVEAKA